MSTLPPGTKGNDFPGLSAQPQLNLAKGGSLPGTEEYQHVGCDDEKKHTPFYAIDEVNNNFHHQTPHSATRLVESPLKRKSKDLIAFNILKRIKQLKKPHLLLSHPRILLPWYMDLHVSSSLSPVHNSGVPFGNQPPYPIVVFLLTTQSFLPGLASSVLAVRIMKA